MPLKKDATAGDYVKDFRKSKAPQFKGKSKDKRHQMAIAAYLDKRDNQKEAKLAGNNLKLFSQLNRNRTKPELDRNIPELSMKLKTKAKFARGLRGPSTKAKPDIFRTTGKRAKDIERKRQTKTLAHNLLEQIGAEFETRGNNIFAVRSALTDWSTHGDTRKTNIDHEAKTRLEREQKVTQWTNSDAFKELSLVA